MFGRNRQGLTGILGAISRAGTPISQAEPAEIPAQPPLILAMQRAAGMDQSDALPSLLPMIRTFVPQVDDYINNPAGFFEFIHKVEAEYNLITAIPEGGETDTATPPEQVCDHGVQFGQVCNSCEGNIAGFISE